VPAQLDRLARGLQPARGAEGQRLALLAGDEPDLAQHRADDQVEGPVAVPVGRERRRGTADVDRFAVAALERLAGRELAVGLPAEEVDLARPGAGEEVGPPVAVQVHQLWSEADASADRDAG